MQRKRCDGQWNGCIWCLNAFKRLLEGSGVISCIACFLQYNSLKVWAMRAFVEQALMVNEHSDEQKLYIKNEYTQYTQCSAVQTKNFGTPVRTLLKRVMTDDGDNVIVKLLRRRTWSVYDGDDDGDDDACHGKDRECDGSICIHLLLLRPAAPTSTVQQRPSLWGGSWFVCLLNRLPVKFSSSKILWIWWPPWTWEGQRSTTISKGLFNNDILQ